MNKLQISIILMILMCLLSRSFESTVGEEEKGEIRNPIKANLIERLTGLLYVSSSPSSSSPSTLTNWDKFKTLFSQAHAYFFPPNLDFRSGEADEGMTNDGGGGAGEKVKDAVTKSLEKSKESVEDSAKSAAKIAGETMHKTTEKVKKSLSMGEKETQPPHQKSQEL